MDQRSSKVSVLVAEDHGVHRDGLCRMIDADRQLKVVATVADGGEAVREAERLAPRVAVIGVSLQGLSPMEAARALGGKAPGTAVVLLAQNASPAIVRRALEAGAAGVVSRTCSGTELVEAVTTVADGRRYVCPAPAEAANGSPAEGAAAPQARGEAGPEALTATERSIVKLVAEGKSNPEVAAVLGLSPRTVETYRLRLMRKVGVENLASLVRFAVRHGIVSLD